MKNFRYIFLSALGLSMLGACTGHKDYENYVASLNEQPALIEKISTPEEYANYATSYVQLTDSFARLDIKMDETQADQVQQLNMKISDLLRAKYDAILADSTTVTPADSLAAAPAESKDSVVAPKGTKPVPENLPDYSKPATIK